MTAMDPYDVSEMAILARMKRVMKEEDGLDEEDFEGLRFFEIESMFLDEFGHDDFRTDAD